MRQFYLLFFCLLITAVVNPLTAQNSLSIEWQNSFADLLNQGGNRVLYTSEGDIVVLAGGSIQGRNGNPSTPPHHNGSVILTKFAANGSIKWWKVYSGGGGSYKAGLDMVQTKDGGFVIVGECSNGSDDPNVLFRVLVIKVDSLGNLQWEKQLGSANQQVGKAVCQKTDGTIIVAGYTNSSDVPAPNGVMDIFVTALDAGGNLLSNNYLGGSGGDYVEAITATSDGGFVIAGESSSNDGIFAGYNPYFVGFVLKFNASNTLQWHRIIRAEDFMNLRDVIEDSDGRYVIVGDVRGSDFINDTGDIKEYVGLLDVWVGKLNAMGDILWQKTIGGSGSDYGYGITETADHALAICGSAGSADHDFAANVKGHRYWVAKVDKQTGRISHQAFLGGKDYSHYFRHVAAAPDGGILAITWTYDDERNPFVADHKGGADGWLVKLQPTLNTIEGYIFEDIIPNGKKDTGEPAFSSGHVKIKKNATDSILVSCKDGYFIFPVDTGKYEVSFVPNKPYYQMAPLSKSYTYATYFNKDTISFAVTPITGKTDFTVNAWSIMPARMGSTIDINIKYANAGTTAINAALKFIKDPRTELRSATLPFIQVEDTVSLSFDALPANTSGDAVLTLYIKTPPDVNWDDTLHHQVSITHAETDQTPDDNFQTLQLPIRAAYDPNDKEEITLSGKMFTKQAQDKAALVYRIRFQNVGNDTAFNIIVRDTIEERLDINTLEMIAADHPYTMQITQGKYVEWHFDNILLPDSNVNEPGSHGFLLFRIKPRKILAIGDTINNTASIYFDYNLPVVTNTAKTVIVPDAPSVPVVTGIGSSYCNSAGVQKGKVANLPATAVRTTATVLLDNVTLPIAADSTFAFKVDTLTPGNHIITVTYSNASGSVQRGITFTVDPLVTPLVDLIASNTNITNMAIPVTVTAVATGGGLSPHYTFARDRNFSNILQAEAAAFVLLINPSTLAVGDNWIYVRMKTSASCYKDQTDMDSVLLRRDQATGIIDPSTPGQIISITPNPFNAYLNIKGLNGGKKYLVVITEAKGQIVKKIQINNLSQTQLALADLKMGIYWLSIYGPDGKYLGTEKLIKTDFE